MPAATPDARNPGFWTANVGARATTESPQPGLTLEPLLLRGGVGEGKEATAGVRGRSWHLASSGRRAWEQESGCISSNLLAST